MWPFKKKTEPQTRKVSRRRSYNAASVAGRYADFGFSSGSADTELINDLVKVRQRARNLFRNSPTMRRYVQLMQDNVVGPHGFRLQVRVQRQDNSPDDALNMRVENAWKKWAKRPTVDNRMSLVAAAKLSVSAWCRDGEVFVEFVTNERYIDGLGLNILEADYCDETLNTTNTTTGNRIRMGVEVDEYGRAIAYHFFTEHPGDASWFNPKNQKRYRRVPASRIVHFANITRPGQTRGEPPAASVLNSIKMLDAYREAEVVNRRIAASAMGFFTNSDPAGEGLQALADGTSDDEGANEFFMEMEPGTLKDLPAGKSFEKFDPGGSVTDYADFETQIKRDISTGLGISVVALGMEYESLSFSTHRGVMQEDREYYSSFQTYMIDTVMTPIYEKWLELKTLNGDTIPPTRFNALNEQYIFRPRGWDWVDPAKDIKAELEAIAGLTSSYSRAAAKRGIDRDELFAEIQADREALRKYGLTPTSVNDSSVTENDDQEDSDEDA